MAGIIDAHQHCWQLNRPECHWPTPDLKPLYRDFGPPELETLARPLGVAGTVLVQSQTDDADTDYLLSLADESDFIRAVVGWVDLKSPQAPERIQALARHPKMRGLRPMLESEADDAWIEDPALDPAIEAMLANRLSFDALVHTRHLPFMARFADRFPQLSIILDHAAKPPIASGDWQPWRDAMADLADRPNIYCKLSGLLTEALPEQGVESLGPWVDELLAGFGPDRLLWGSDWPVVNLAADYSRWLSQTQRLLSALNDADRQQILSGTARKVYRLNVRQQRLSNKEKDP